MRTSSSAGRRRLEKRVLRCRGIPGLFSHASYPEDFLDSTAFFYHYHDYPKEMEALAKSVENYYEPGAQILAESSAEAVFWGGNFDETLTFPPYFKKEILRGSGKAADVFTQRASR